MCPVPRTLAGPLLQAASDFPAVVLTGPRRSGKTTLLRTHFPRATYVLLEDPDVIIRVAADPRAFLDSLRPPVILDEIQNAPELFAYVRTRIDSAPTKKGRWFLTGSQESALMPGVTESLAGRAAVFTLLLFGLGETPRVDLLLGGFPEAVLRPKSAGTWFRSYLRTYLERDVRAVSEVRDPVAFQRFLVMLASRIGQVLNKTALAAPLGVSVPTIGQWISILQITGLIALVPPYFENFGKRLVKSPKLYFIDSGLACHLLGITSAGELERSPFLGPLFESFVASELIKHRVHAGRSAELYWFRDRSGLEVDSLLPAGSRRLILIEAKATRTLRPADASPLVRLSEAATGFTVSRFVVHRGSPTPAGSALHPGTRALTLPALLDALP